MLSFSMLMISMAIYEVKLYSLIQAAAKGIYSAFFYLGIMFMEGLYPVKGKDPVKAMQLYIKGAAKNNAFCYFELARIYGEGVIVPKDEKL